VIRFDAPLYASLVEAGDDRLSPAVVTPWLWLVAPALRPAGNGGVLGPSDLTKGQGRRQAPAPVRQRSLPKAETHRGYVSRLGGE